MNKIILGLSLIVSGISFSQSFTWVDGKTIETDIVANTTVQLKIEQLAIPGDSVTLGIEVVERQIPNSWDGMLCVHGLCYGTIREVGFTGEMTQIKDDTRGYARLTVNPMNTLTQGLYKVRVFDVDNPSDGDTAVWILNAVTGIEDNYLDAISMYPNPVTNNLSIDSDGTINTISVLNLNGQLMQEINKVNSGVNTIDVSDLPRGMYLVRLTNSKGDVSVRKVSFI
jgi:hypothetical protein